MHKLFLFLFILNFFIFFFFKLNFYLFVTFLVILLYGYYKFYKKLNEEKLVIIHYKANPDSGSNLTTFEKPIPVYYGTYVNNMNKKLSNYEVVYMKFLIYKDEYTELNLYQTVLINKKSGIIIMTNYDLDDAENENFKIEFISKSDEKDFNEINEINENNKKDYFDEIDMMSKEDK